jgi:hypothetical protein
LAFSQAINSLRFIAGTVFLAIITHGTKTSGETGAKSLSTSYGSE